MESSLKEARPRCSPWRPLLWIVVLLAATSSRVPGQATPSSHVPPNEVIRAHFATAQQAQQQGDYVTAEREYQAVLIELPGFAEARMNLGLIYQLQNRIPEAMVEFHRALKIKPTLAGANFFLGVDYCKRGKGREAIPYLRAAARQQPARPDIWSWLATAQEISGDLSGEITTLRHAVSLQPQNVDLLYLLGHAYERMGRLEVTGLEKVAPASSWSEQLLAESYSSSGEWSFAIIRFQNALAISPNRPGLHAGMGEVFLRAGRLDQADQEFEWELLLDPSSLQALVRRGEVSLLQGDVDKAMQDWELAASRDLPRAERILGMRETGFGDAALEQLPDSLRERLSAIAPQIRTRQDAASRLAIGFLAVQNGNAIPPSTEVSQPGSLALLDGSPCIASMVRQELNGGQFSAAYHCLLRVLTPQSPPDFRLQVAEALFELGSYEGSLKALGGLSAGAQNSPEAFYWRARCFEKLATAAYLDLYQADSNSYRVHQLMGDLEAAKNNDGKAIEEYRTAVTMKPSVANLHYSLGHVLWKELKTADARVEFEAELGLNPHHPGALHDLGDTYLSEHDPKQALTYLKRALEVDPEDQDLHRDLGTAYAELHEYANAEAEFKEALPGDHDGSVHYQLGRVYQALGKKDEATREFAISTSMNRESHAKLEKETERLKQIEGTPQRP